MYYGDRKMLDQYDDRIDTLSRGFLGLTVACARCHDHKFDPISTADYYALAGVIASTEYVEEPLVSPAEVEAADKSLTADEKKKKVKKYPFIHALKDAEKPVTMQVHIRGMRGKRGSRSSAAIFVDLVAGRSAAFRTWQRPAGIGRGHRQ